LELSEESFIGTESGSLITAIFVSFRKKNSTDLLGYLYSLHFLSCGPYSPLSKAWLSSLPITSINLIYKSYG